MASKAKRQAAIDRATEQVNSGSGFIRSATPDPTPSIVERLRGEAAELHVRADRLEEHGWPQSAEQTRLRARTPEGAANLIEEQQRQLDEYGESCPDGPACSTCPCAAEDDACFPGERLRAERDQLQRQLERVGEAVEAALAELSKGKWGKAFAILETDEVRAALHNDKGGEGE